MSAGDLMEPVGLILSTKKKCKLKLRYRHIFTESLRILFQQIAIMLDTLSADTPTTQSIQRPESS